MMCARALSALGVYAVEMYFIPRYVMLYCVYNAHVYTIVHINVYANVRSRTLPKTLGVVETTCDFNAGSASPYICVVCRYCLKILLIAL